jgi:hypothetical protein
MYLFGQLRLWVHLDKQVIFYTRCIACKVVEIKHSFIEFSRLLFIYLLLFFLIPVRKFIPVKASWSTGHPPKPKFKKNIINYSILRLFLEMISQKSTRCKRNLNHWFNAVLRNFKKQKLVKRQ